MQSTRDPMSNFNVIQGEFECDCCGAAALRITMPSQSGEYYVVGNFTACGVPGT